MNSLLLETYPGVIGVGFTAALMLVGASSGVLAGRVRRRGFLLVRGSRFQQRARRWSAPLYESARRAARSAGAEDPDSSVLVQLDAWSIAVKEQVLFSAPLAVLAVAALSMALTVTLAARVSWTAFLWVLLPAVALAALSTLPMRLDDIALRRGHSADLVALAAVQALAACDRHRDLPSAETTVRLDDSVHRLKEALGLFARSGVTRSGTRRRRLVGQAAAMGVELDLALDAVYRDRSQLPGLVQKVLHVLASMRDQNILALVDEQAGRDQEHEEIERRLPWGDVAAHVVSFAIGCGLLAAVRALDLSTELVTVVVLPVVVLVMRIPYVLIRRSAAGVQRLAEHPSGPDDGPE